MTESVVEGTHMKLTLAETKLIKDTVGIIADLVTEVRFKFTSNGVELISMDPANVAMVIFRLLSSAFVEYDVKQESDLCVNLNDLKGILRRVKPSDTLTIEPADNKLKITLKGSSTRQFFIPLIDMDEREQKIPDLNFTATVKTLASRFSEAVEDADIIGESVSMALDNGSFVISSSSDLSEARIELPADDATKISGPDETRSKYSIEYLKRMIAASKLTDTVDINFSMDYPLKLEYKLIDKLELSFILAPRVDND